MDRMNSEPWSCFSENTDESIFHLQVTSVIPSENSTADWKFLVRHWELKKPHDLSTAVNRKQT